MSTGGRAQLKEPEESIKKASDILIEEKKEDYFAILSVLTGLYYPNLAKKLLERRDMMLKSIVYDIIKKEGIEEGKLEGLRKGVLSVLRARFDRVPRKVTTKIKKIRKSTKLEHLLKIAAISKDIEEFEKNLE
ncbi:MAG: hypothetical protein ACE5J3_14520 [Methanosarcinales archaeon]